MSPHSPWFCIDFSDVSYKQRVSRTTEASALRFCDTPADLSPTEVLVAWRNHLYPNRLQIGEAVVFCCVLLFFLHRDLLLSNAVWVPSSGSRLQGFTTLFKQLLLVHCRKRNGWEDERDKMDTGDYISLVSLRSPWPLIIIQLWFLQRCVFEKKKCLSVLVDLCLITQRGYSTSTELWCRVSLIFSPLDGDINENMSVDGERYRFGCHFIYQDNCFSLTAIIKKCVFFILSLNVNYPSIAGVALVIGFPFFDVTADQSCSLSL